MKKLWSFILSVILVLGMSTSVWASQVTSSPLPDLSEGKKGSLTIYKYEVKSPTIVGDKDDNTDGGIGKPATGETVTPAPDNDSSGNVVLLPGVKFSIQRTHDVDGTKLGTPDTAIEQTTGDGTTGEKGKAYWSNLPLGKYHVTEVEVPANVTSKIPEFDVDIPMTNKDGTGWIYDVVLYPKNETVYGKIKLNKYSETEGTNLPGVTFKLQKFTGTLPDSIPDDFGKSYDASDTTWTDYTTTSTLVTDNNGEINIENLPKGWYRLVETATVEGYALHNQPVVFEVTNDQVVQHNKINFEKPEIDKSLNLDEQQSYKAGDKVTWTLNVKVPTDIKDYKEFYILDNLDTDLDYAESNYGSPINTVITGTKRDGTGTENVPNFSTDTAVWKVTTSVSDGVTTLKIIFIDKDNKLSGSSGFTGSPTTLEKYSNLEIKVTTTIKASGLQDTITNQASMDFDNSYEGKGTVESEKPNPDTTDPTDPVIKPAGKVTIKKQDKDTNTMLGGAKFKLYQNESDAEEVNDDCMKGSDGNPIILETSSNEDATKGIAEIDDLFYTGSERTLYLVEIQAPEGYKLLNAPVEVKIDGTPKEITVPNAKSTLWDDMMPATGGLGTPLFLAMGICVVIFGLLYYRRQSRKN